MVIHLRPYQLLALYHLRKCLHAGVWRQYLDLPTGTGKSTIAAAFAAQRLKQTKGASWRWCIARISPCNWWRRSGRKILRWVC
jgi:hypothetical protein